MRYSSLFWGYFWESMQWPLWGNILILTVITLSSDSKPPWTSFFSISPFLRSDILTPLPLRCCTLLLGTGVISFAGCMSQFYFFGSMAAVECFLLAAMCHDTSLIDLHTSILLAGGSWLGRFLSMLLQIVQFHFLWLNNIPLSIQTTFSYPIYSLAIINNVVVNIGMQISL